MSYFNDHAGLCMTGLGGPMELDYFRPEEPCTENWINWDDDIPIIGWIDAPNYSPAGFCQFDDSFLGDGPEQVIIKRK